MAGRRMSKNAGSDGCSLAILVIVGVVAITVVANYIIEHSGPILVVSSVIAAVSLVCFIAWSIVKRRRRELLNEILGTLQLYSSYLNVPEYDDYVVVKSRQALENYTDLVYLKDKNVFQKAIKVNARRKEIRQTISAFLENNIYENRAHFGYVQSKFYDYLQLSDTYKVWIQYITPAGNNRGEKILRIPSNRIEYLCVHPEQLMSKGEYNRFNKQREKAILESKKAGLYARVTAIIDYVDRTKESLVVKTKSETIDKLLQELFDGTIDSIQRIPKVDSYEYVSIDRFIDSKVNSIHSLVQEDKRISDYYSSEDFARIKETCDMLTKSQREFNEYINEKASSISKLLGTRSVRTETQINDTYNYNRIYKKSIDPFTAEVSSTVFGSAENNPLDYIVKYFYPNRGLYKEQIAQLSMLIEELETLREAKDIIENYKNDYNEYIQTVPDYVLSEDEDGFYSRLGLAIIDESVLNMEYRFVYTSGGGKAQRSFPVPMTEENISALISVLENKITAHALIKEQRALMTTKLRKHIKERDNYTCCQCGNSIYKEPNLLLEIDHIIPVSKGGLTQEDNLQVLCWKCNRNKGAKVLS